MQHGRYQWHHVSAGMKSTDLTPLNRKHFPPSSTVHVDTYGRDGTYHVQCSFACRLACPSVSKLFCYVACQRFIGEVLSVFTNLEVVFGWHLGGEVALGEREVGGRRERKPASEMVIVSMHLAHSEWAGSMHRYARVQMRVCVCACLCVCVFNGHMK